MKAFLTVIVLILIIVFSGCTASSLSEMSVDKDVKQKRLIVDENYQQTYKRALEKSRECFELSILTSSVVVNGQIYSELREADLSVYQSGSFGKNMRHGAKFIALDDKKTDLIIFSYSDYFLDKIKRMYTGECTSCYCTKEDKR